MKIYHFIHGLFINKSILYLQLIVNVKCEKMILDDDMYASQFKSQYHMSNSVTACIGVCVLEYVFQ